MKQSRFETKCRKVANDVLGDEDKVDFHGIQPYQDPFEDDGALFVIDKRTMEEAVFDIGQDAPAEEANTMTRQILRALKLEKKITDRVLVDEPEDNDVCPRCGQSV